MAISAWVSPGVQMSTRSTSSRVDERLRQSVSTCCQPSRRGAPLAGGLGVPAADGGEVRHGSGRSKNRPAVRQACEWAAPMNA